MRYKKSNTEGKQAQGFIRKLGPRVCIVGFLSFERLVFRLKGWQWKGRFVATSVFAIHSRSSFILQLTTDCS